MRITIKTNSLGGISRFGKTCLFLCYGETELFSTVFMINAYNYEPSLDEWFLQAEKTLLFYENNILKTIFVLQKAPVCYQYRRSGEKLAANM